ncbi:DUF2935 domain-containing protein [Clostridium estertheticum]|uniref:DUF2935 domain-containing protein n=2 Tax=Clostridium estertheticum TaxID=238834 RepID=A0A1J0GFA9_9CLOT|nr:DUF2935 domain-containing protein [Clostridium estertheticum]APC39987.1 hypothetical protein A7L45_07870 [Clostridium estertheticum subsp. estertheticum]MBU3172515.1 DUF2935 domain-containing protein [Clostridium estertheticum]MBZ9613930.1 DUF2935 domain-containing protein [Clostridium estertheticum subsp. laramiense]MPQ31281.1 DUF2935 domain-containing protein [Clostridium estertheticum]MPQ61955.1 DUF2935 domain-containing protein [Clostridium estertheticum]
MYCHTHINQFSCVFNELQLWSHISSDHPNFLKNVANLSKINLPKVAEDQLDDIHKMFLGLYNNIIYLKKVVVSNPKLYNTHILAVKKVIDEFLLHDTHALSFYPQLLAFGKENDAWQELVKHIINEQNFMFELFTDLKQQI